MCIFFLILYWFLPTVFMSLASICSLSFLLSNSESLTLRNVESGEVRQINM